ncbi:hypothetical protein VU04_00260 [Desulfobulbus sp. TB]|nr:hypothetical protein [Desulfobulbus sp. TB]
MKVIKIISSLYRKLSSNINDGSIPIHLRYPSLVGTVQDDPFDSWIGDEIKKCMPELEVHHAGKLTTPDIILRDQTSNTIVGLEVKKLIQQKNGNDPRGLTLDYNSCVPCGKALIKVGKDTVEIPCFYLFALLSPDSSSIVTSILIDGDFLNYDFELHKHAKYANQSEYKHGPYGEGSVRHRRMYTYPNPLNYKLSFFHLRHLLVIKKHDLPDISQNIASTDLIIRDDNYKNSFHYLVLDRNSEQQLPLEQLPVRQDIFKPCKERKPKVRTASMPCLPSGAEG